MLKKYAKEFPTNLKLAYPVMIGQIGQVLVGLIDNIMVGRLGALPLAAVSLGNAVFAIAMSLAIGFSFSITPLIAESDGQKNIEKGRLIFKNGVWFCLAIGMLLYGLIKAMQPLLEHLNQPTDVVILATPYLDITAISIIPFTFFMGFKQFSNGMSATRYAMIATICGNLINILLNYLLIYGKLGFPRLEIVGAAIGTLISRTLMIVFIVFILYSKKQFTPYFKNFFFPSFNPKTLFKILVLGFPVALQMLFEFGFFSSSIILSGNLSTENQAANQIALNLASMSFMIALGLGVTATIRTANHIGKQGYNELTRIINSIILLTILLEILLALFFIATHNYLPSIYIDNTAVIAIAAQLIIIVALFQVNDGLQVVLIGTLRGFQDVNKPTLIIFIAYWCIGFPIAYFLGSNQMYSTIGIWIGLLAGLFASSILLFMRYKYLIKKLPA